LLKPGKAGMGHRLPVCCREHIFPRGVMQMGNQAR
jgi:hypothetical protein